MSPTVILGANVVRDLAASARRLREGLAELQALAADEALHPRTCEAFAALIGPLMEQAEAFDAWCEDVSRMPLTKRRTTKRLET